MTRCYWTEDEDGNWETSCGNAFVMQDGTPDDNNFKFCVYCGGTLRQEPADETDCTCRLEPVTPTMINPPEMKRDKNCPVHGRDPDYERDRDIDDKATGDA